MPQRAALGVLLLADRSSYTAMVLVLRLLSTYLRPFSKQVDTLDIMLHCLVTGCVY